MTGLRTTAGGAAATRARTTAAAAGQMPCRTSPTGAVEGGPAVAGPAPMRALLPDLAPVPVLRGKIRSAGRLLAERGLVLPRARLVAVLPADLVRTGRGLGLPTVRRAAVPVPAAPVVGVTGGLRRGRALSTAVPLARGGRRGALRADTRPATGGRVAAVEVRVGARQLPSATAARRGVKPAINGLAGVESTLLIKVGPAGVDIRLIAGPSAGAGMGIGNAPVVGGTSLTAAAVTGRRTTAGGLADTVVTAEAAAAGRPITGADSTRVGGTAAPAVAALPIAGRAEATGTRAIVAAPVAVVTGAAPGARAEVTATPTGTTAAAAREAAGAAGRQAIAGNAGRNAGVLPTAGSAVRGKLY
jgi:hypothetical protein